VGQQDALDLHLGLEGRRQQLVHFVARVDQHASRVRSHPTTKPFL
jgi:hypothetical protein